MPATDFLIDIKDLIMKDQIPEQLAIEDAASIGTEWVNQCQSNHDSCKKHDESQWLPTRLLEIELVGGQTKVRLCHSSELSGLPSKPRYATLSHRWGLDEDTVFKLTTANLAELTSNMPLEKLSPLFLDAIHLVQGMGIKYLWIDSLCIIQNAKDDWLAESKMMGEVYYYGFFNIAATGFQDGRQGLVPPRKVPYYSTEPITLSVRPCSIENIGDKYTTNSGEANILRILFAVSPHHVMPRDTVTPQKFYILEDWWETDVNIAPLNERAWVYQERYLAQRILHFGPRQIYWECIDLAACEAFPAGLPDKIATGKLSNIMERLTEDDLSTQDAKDRALRDWTWRVSYYNGTKLTFGKDKLIAISGIAKKYGSIIKENYMAGLWDVVPMLPVQLLWQSSFTTVPAGMVPRPSEYQAPSWSCKCMFSFLYIP